KTMPSSAHKEFLFFGLPGGCLFFVEDTVRGDHVGFTSIVRWTFPFFISCHLA
ncbi:Uncharacterized protein APZ42_003816, partial [Daphnia magna]